MAIVRALDLQFAIQRSWLQLATIAVTVVIRQNNLLPAKGP